MGYYSCLPELASSCSMARPVHILIVTVTGYYVTHVGMYCYILC